MDNSQFRALLQTDSKGPSPKNDTTAPGFKKPTLGSRMRSSVPMTPRSVGGYNATRDFAKQVAEHERNSDGQPPTKKFKSNAAPKGTKLAAGYSDRTNARRTGEDGELEKDDKEKRLKALEEMYKLQQIDQATLEHLKREIGIGGTLGTTHLVKGLDWTLLERARRGENLNATPLSEQVKDNDDDKIDLDDELDHALENDVAANTAPSRKEAADMQSKENTAPQATTRDEILRKLKESRMGRTISDRIPEPSLGDKFKKVGSEPKPTKKKFIENIDGRRREVLLITNKDGTTKRKTRWLDKVENTVQKDSAPLGMQVPAEFLAKQKEWQEKEDAEDDDDIFGGVAEYNPLAGLKSESSESDNDERNPDQRDVHATPEKGANGRRPRNYFDAQNESGQGEDRSNPITKDPTLLAALKRAATLRREEGKGRDGGDNVHDSDPNREAKQRQFLARLKEQDRADAADLDLGFGESRFGDDDDEDGEVWAGEKGEAKKPARKRGGKKRKGDKDNVNDVMSVLEGRTKA
ncbi:uncharacterized protein A1O9_09555 [Exophiala aquamarina CBS 119918]|uniref:RED-like N-terminal domain-containing protein n=1 Tax=Exophiala aquamarina CBS 119918 TaxID=1182545 RepID=A0A072P2R5_9EURO|nr:uncharacterized protein A1O9_09555 [Exophiala aquamarina CBS 119918]KEF54389.1 hypothetical protein A1O9_09555 [Exophiala aquamarina CBS 119918]